MRVATTGEFVLGEIIAVGGIITLNRGRETAEVTVGDTGDRPIQVGSRFHFFEADVTLSFGREAACGMQSNIPAGAAVRFEPGGQTSVGLVAIGDKRWAHGTNGIVNSSINTDPSTAVERLRVAGFADTGAPGDEHGITEESSE